MTLNKTYLFYLLLFLIGYGLSAQKTKATLTFKDGTVLEGLGKLTMDEKIKFRKAKKEKKVWYSLSDNLEKAMILEQGVWVTYVYKKVKDRTMGKVLREVLVGKVSLYSRISSGTMMAPIGGAGGGGAPMMMHSYSIENSYVRREGESQVTHLGSNQPFTKNFKKAASKYFEDCPVLVKKIQNKEYKKRHLKEIVSFYNRRCTEN